MGEWVRLTPEGAAEIGRFSPLFCLRVEEGLMLARTATPSYTGKHHDMTRREALALAAQLPEVEALVEFVRGLEWSQQDAHDRNYCPLCDGYADSGGHGEWCEFPKVLAPFKKEA